MNMEHAENMSVAQFGCNVPYDNSDGQKTKIVFRISFTKIKLNQ